MTAGPTHDVARLFEDAPCGLLVTSEDGTILRANATFCGWAGVTAADLLGTRRLQDMFTMGARIFHQTHWAPLLRMQGSVAEVKVEILHADGSKIPLLMNAVRRTHADGVQHELAMFIAKDRAKYESELVLARKRAEDSLASEQAAQAELALAETRLRIALQSGKLFVWDIDPVTRERRYDNGVALLLGYPASRPVTADDVFAAMSDTDREAEDLALNRALGQPDEALRVVVAFQGVDGVRRIISASGLSVFDAQGTLVRCVGVLEDISDDVRLRESAEDRARFAEQMVGIVSHDLRNPLSTIAVATQALLLGKPDARQMKLLQFITRAAQRSSRLIADLLDFTLARVGRGINVAPRPINLHEVTAHAVSELGLTFSGGRLVHRQEGSGVCHADPDRLTQLLGNLVANAMTYGALDTPVEVITIVEPTSFSVQVRNQGPPIPDTLLATMFEPMTRGHDVPESARSVGLGLYIVREIAAAHGGTVDVRSLPSGETTFTAVFPRSRAVD